MATIPIKLTKAIQYSEGNPGDVVLHGYYIPPASPLEIDAEHHERKKYPFSVTKMLPNNKNSEGSGYSWVFQVENDDYKYPTFEITPENTETSTSVNRKNDFVSFMTNVLDKNKSLYDFIHYDKKYDIGYHGTWTSYDMGREKKANQMISDPNKTHPMDWEAFISEGGSSRKSKRIHRKPTKRRRNRRGNRKTKKN